MREMQRCRHRQIHTEVEREQRGHLEQNVEKCYSTGPHIHLYRLCTKQLQGLPFSTGHHMMGSQELCNHANLHLDPWDPQFLQQGACMRAKLLQSCPTLYDPMDHSLPGSSAHGILQARILEWVTIPFSRGSSQLRDQTQVSHIACGFFTI